jgi:hypothetical protein
MRRSMGGANHFKEVRAGVAEKWLASHAGNSPPNGRSSNHSKSSSRSPSDDNQGHPSDGNEGVDSDKRAASGTIPVNPVIFRPSAQTAPNLDTNILQQFHNPRVRSQATSHTALPQETMNPVQHSPPKVVNSTIANGNEKLYEAYNDLHR